MTDDAPVLWVVGTPIGNLGDLTTRAREALAAADAIVCEDTRRTAKLLSHLGIARPGLYFSCHDANERQVVTRVLGLLRAGHKVALCSDAGMPLVSDPGFVVVREARAEGFDVEVLPGPSAVLTALIASGLPVHSFTFKGFSPRKAGKRRAFLEMEADSPHTLVLFESAPRLPKLLALAAEVLGPRDAAVCLELTKKFERVERGTLDELAGRFDKAPKGEVTVVISGAQR